MLAQSTYFGYRIREISCPTMYFKEPSSINFTRSVKYGFGVIDTMLKRTPKVDNCAELTVQLNRQEMATELLQSRPSPDKDRQSGDPTSFLGGGEDSGVNGTGLKSSWPNSPRYVHLGEHVTEESLA